MSKSSKSSKEKQDYRSSSNSTLQAERLSKDEPTGEPETLWGKIGNIRMGDRAQISTRDKEFEERLTKLKAKKSKQEAKKKRKRQEGGILSAGFEVGGLYKPKSKETKQVYELILNFVQSFLGDQPQDIIRGAADETLSLLKREGMKDPDKKLEVEKLLGVMSEPRFAELQELVKKITDYDESEMLEGEGIDSEFGVAVVFDEDEEEEEEEEYVVREEESEEEGEEVTTESQSLETLTREEVEDAMEEENPLDVDPKEIKAFWLKAQVTEKVDSDPVNSQKLAEKILTILQETQDDRTCENQLVQLLDYEKFDFIKLLMRNKLKIVWCTKLARAEDDIERQKIEAEMKEDPELSLILDSLHKSGAKSKMEQALKKEARILKTREEDQKNQEKVKARILDLEALAFEEGGRLMSNKTCALPPGSFRKQKKGYEEVHVPALKAPPLDATEKMVAIAEMPEWAQKAFEGMTSLNRIQSRLYKAAFQSHENLLLCAPTGAGKTNVAMLCILHEIGLNMSKDGLVDLNNFKVIYIAPMKSLVAEMVGNFGKRLSKYGISVKELTGDANLTKQQIKETQIIVTTPEKWDIITRKSGDRTFTEVVKLIIIDEIHLLHDDRGPVLESIVARTMRQIESTQEMIRLVGLSATLPNYEDVATFLRVEPQNVFAFNNSFRPCPLEQQYIGITEKKAIKRFQLMNEITYEKVVAEAGKQQILVFVHSRKETAKTARALRDMALANDDLSKFLKEGSASKEILQTEAEESIKTEDLKDLLPYGFGIHHAGLPRSDRDLVEDLFADGHIQVLVSTATLAWGVNLPAHTVIIKGTQIYSPEKGRWVELSPMDIMQMLGRAGRPQYDTFGEGIIITGHAELQYCLSLMNQQLPIESQFISKLADNLNAEIVLGTIQNIEEAANWLGYTYLYICMLRNPTLYGVSYDEIESDKLLKKRRLDLVHSAATLLDKANLIKYDRRTGNFQVTDLGIVASHYYVAHGSMGIYNEHLKPNMSDIELFRLFSISSEFKYIGIRQEERQELQKLLDRVPIPIKENMEPSAKINVLLQAYISRLKLDGFALQADMVYITQSAGRLFRALFEICLKRGWAQVADKCLTLCKMVTRRMWSTQSPLRQFGDIPEDILRKLERKDFPMERLYDLNAQELGELVNYQSIGKTLHRRIHQFPRLELTANFQPITRSILSVELTITPDFQFDTKYHQFAEPFWILVEDVDTEALLHYEYFILKEKFAKEEHILTFTVPLLEPIQPQYFIRVVSDRWLGSETVLSVSFRRLILPEKFPPHTELLDLRPLPISELKNPSYEALFKDKLKNNVFNPIQTQVFNTLYTTDNNTLVAAPTGSGKTFCAEFAIFNMLNQNPKGKCVFIAPHTGLAKERFNDWEKRFEEKLKVNVALLTGEATVDLKLLESAQIVISTPENWDLLSRRWKQRQGVKNINLFIVDELHLLGNGESGTVIEVIVSRMRYIASQNETKCRIVAFSSSLANAKDIAEWIGATPHSTFNFHPNSRPVPLEIHLQGFEFPNFSARMMAMSRPTLYSVQQLAKGKPVIIFVPARKYAKMTAQDLISFRDPKDPHKRFLFATEENMAPYLEKVSSQALKEALSNGIAFYHEGLTETEKKIIEYLFSAGGIQILVSTYNMCWGMTLSASLVIIMGTQYYDGKEHRYVDYPLSDILQMMGRASRPLQDEIGKCVLYCYAPRKEFYKKFLYEPLPVESHLDHFLADNMNAEIVTKTIENKQDAVDYLTWTFLYRRLILNPNYYNLQGNQHHHLSDHLSELIEQTLTELDQAKCITIEDDFLVSPLNLGMIACYYNIKYTTVALFDSNLNAKTRLKGLLDILASATEFETIPIRRGEEQILRKIGTHLPLRIDKPNFSTPETKVNVLLQSHFSRTPLSSDLLADQSFILENSLRLLQAMVDVTSSNGWLNPALAAMELSQMIVQAMWDNDSHLKQLPYFDETLIQRCKEKKVENIYDLTELENAQIKKLLQLDDQKMKEVASVCNRYPNIDLNFTVENEKVSAGENVTVFVELEREIDEDQELLPVHAPFFPKEKIEGWWLVIGDKRENQLYSIKKITLQRKYKAKLEFIAPEKPGNYSLQLFFMCDSYAGCDQENEIQLQIQHGTTDKMEE